ncbi:outer membrane protein assembly factor BamE [Methylophaga sp. OBS1]|jgi:outer membrane protein assembly factor BamE|uniref:outer membrane protein assembly factor BamE n=1 Tax=Methylophaga sp. OBS1 TaxID=2991933 RepID=UPI0022595F6F|nr:outer membrane protein assembly factor BamE [Methylophaga sp. OBS1]MCX4192720.1 outer membrane protein assembly factor BamE [Methylophaga sp. OBS1]
MKSFIVYSLSVTAFLLLSACSTDNIPGLYQIDVQQGNNVDQEMINKLEPGMTKNQVAYVMGTPLLIDTFHPNRWDYIYSYQPGGEEREQRRITLYFNDDETLSHVEGDTRIVASREELPQADRQDKNVVVPLNQQKTGFFGGLMNLIGLGDDEEVEIIDDPENTEEEAQEAANKAMMEEAAGGELDSDTGAASAPE